MGAADVTEGGLATRASGGSSAALRQADYARIDALDDNGLPSSERVYQALKEQILGAALPPGARLVELQLAGQFGVSRTPVREALKRLTAEGMVVVDPVRGMVVRDVDPVEIEEIYVIREALDSLAARLAAQRVTAADITKLRLLMELMRDSVRARRWEALVQANIKFHEVIYGAAGNQRLSLLARSLQDFVRRFSTKAFASPERDEEVLQEHEAIVAALEARDPDRAEAASRTHLTEARAFLAHLYLSQST